MNIKDGKRVKTLEAELVRIRNEIYVIKEPYEKQEASSLVGKCFRVSNNYSCPEKPSDYWWLYVKVLRVGKHNSIECLQFQTDKDGDVTVKVADFYMTQTLARYEPISAGEFNRQYARMLKHLEKANAD